MVSSPCKYYYALPRYTNTDTDKFCNRAGQDKRREKRHISVLEELAGSRLGHSCWAKYWFPTQHVISALHRQWCAPVLFKWLFTARQNIINAGSVIIHKCLNPYKRLQPSVNVSQVYHVTRERVLDYYQRFWYEKVLHCVLGLLYIYTRPYNVYFTLSVAVRWMAPYMASWPCRSFLWFPARDEVKYWYIINRPWKFPYLSKA